MDSDDTKRIYEIAIQEVKSEHEATYPEARAAFLRLLAEQPGVERDWTLRSFFTMPEPDRGTVLIGLTRWSSIEAFNRAAATLQGTEAAQAVFSKVNMRAFVQARPVGDAPLLLEEHLTDPDSVLEVAVRRPKEGVSEEDYDAAYDAFFALVDAQPGLRHRRELRDDAGDRIVLIVWESRAAFTRALGFLQGRREMGDFFSMIDVQAYQAGQLT